MTQPVLRHTSGRAWHAWASEVDLAEMPVTMAGTLCGCLFSLGRIAEDEREPTCPWCLRHIAQGRIPARHPERVAGNE